MNDLRARAQAFLDRPSPFGPEAGHSDLLLLIRRYLAGGPWDDLVPLNQPDALLTFLQDVTESARGEHKQYCLELLAILRDIHAEVAPLNDAVAMSPRMPEHLEMGDQTENSRRAREIQILVNIVEPDPQYQPWFLADDATAFDISLLEESTIRARLETYFGQPLPVPVSTPLWRLVDALKAQHPDWPDDWQPEK